MLGRRFDKIFYPKNNNNNNNNNKTVLGTRNHFESAEIDHKNLAEKEDVSCMIHPIFFCEVFTLKGVHE